MQPIFHQHATRLITMLRGLIAKIIFFNIKPRLPGVFCL